jgi:hypothetical protein
MMLARLARTVALAIAVAGIADPVITLERRGKSPLTIAVLEPPSPGRTSVPIGGDGGPSGGRRSVERLRTALAPSFDVRVDVVAPTASPAACPPSEACVIVTSDGSAARHLVGEDAMLVGVVQTTRTPAPDAAIAELRSAGHQHPLASGRLNVVVEARGATGSSRIEVLDAGAVVGTATVTWLPSSDAGLASRQSADIDFWPIAEGLRRLIVRISALEGERELANNTAEIAIDVARRAATVLVYEGRPSWATTFVRRALEADPRFQVRTVSRLGPDISVSAARGLRLEAGVVEAAQAVIIGAPEELSAPEAALLERFVRVRGGSLVLVPDRALSGAVARLVPAGARERLERESVVVGPLRASELLVFPSVPVAARVIAATSDQAAVVVAAPLGAGRLVLSGALDAWRHRDADEGRFGAFWQALVADAVLASGDTFDLIVTPRAARPGDDIRIAVVHRALSPGPEPLAVGAEIACGGRAAQPVRLWPAGERRLEGLFRAAFEGPCRVLAHMTAPEQRQVEAHVLVSADVSPAPDQRRASAPARLAGAFGVPTVTAGDEEALVPYALAHAPARRESIPVHPLRSPLWIVPFAICLGGEWWLRRRRGLR